ncbi:hypothetical protein M0R45_008383 [Rubus argutus]|uniref:Cytochrome c heme attachment protein n=1 Tax=Rubus argutus TaxID=59490 RepID=A0AAW1Y497_RUBAR
MERNIFRRRVVALFVKNNSKARYNVREMTASRVLNEGTYKLFPTGLTRKCFPSFSKGNYVLPIRNMSTLASVGIKEKEGFKFLVNGGPHAQKMIGIWLFGSATWVFSMVILGDWLIEFGKYKQSPEYKRVNRGMSIVAFKFIYWMEYAHRSNWLEPTSENVQPRVSPYRLAAHLTSAFVIYCGLLWTGLSVVMPEPPAESVAWVHGVAKVKRLALPVSLLVRIIGISGAFVARNDAGHAYNTFPKIGDRWISEDVFDMKPLIRNFFENISTVQLNHRILATATLFSIGALWWSTRKFDIHPAI